MGPKEENKVKKIPFYKRKAFIITLIVIVVLLIVGVLAYRKLASTVTQVPDEYVDDGSYADVGMNNYYSGVVEAEQTSVNVQAKKDQTGSKCRNCSSKMQTFQMREYIALILTTGRHGMKISVRLAASMSC